jgi:uncharacterized protein (UPF0548 family)
MKQNDDEFQLTDRFVSLGSVEGQSVAGGERRSIEIDGGELVFTATRAGDQGVADFFESVRAYGRIDQLAIGEDEAQEFWTKLAEVWTDSPEDEESDECDTDEGVSPITIFVDLVPATTLPPGLHLFRVEIDPKITLQDQPHKWCYTNGTLSVKIYVGEGYLKAEATREGGGLLALGRRGARLSSTVSESSPEIESVKIWLRQAKSVAGKYDKLATGWIRC